MSKSQHQYYSSQDVSSFHFGGRPVCVSEFPPECQTAGRGFPGSSRLLMKVCSELKVTCRHILHSSGCFSCGKQCVFCAVSLGRPIISLQPADTDLHMDHKTRPCVLVCIVLRHVCLTRETAVLLQHI